MSFRELRRARISLHKGNRALVRDIERLEAARRETDAASMARAMAYINHSSAFWRLGTLGSTGSGDDADKHGLVAVIQGRKA